MKQCWLPGFDGRDPEDGPRFETTLEDFAQETQAGGVPVLPGQAGLFTAERELIGLIESAILDGRFEDARRRRDELVVLEGPSPDTRRLAVLERLGAPDFWERPIERCVDDWLTLAREAAAGDGGLHPLIREGVTARLLADHGSGPIVRARPSMLAAIVNFLGRVADDPDAAGSPGNILRDALAAGIEAASGDFDDPAFVDLLAEDRAPQWLACLGALRRLWAVPAAGAEWAGEALPPPPEDDERRGEQFWRCLQVAASSPRDSVVAGEARKRMKQLDPALHGWFMRQGVRRE